MSSLGSYALVTLVRTDVSEERIASIIKATRISELGTLAISSKRITLLTLFLARRFLSPWWGRRYVLQRRRFLQEPHGVSSKKKAFFIGMATGYGLDYRDIGVRVQVMSRTSTFHIVQTGFGTTLLPIQCEPVYLPPGVKRQGREAHNSSLTSAEAKKSWIYTATAPYVFIAQSLSN
jgi:hypothetical protein